MSLIGGGLVVKRDWTELTEDDQTDIKKLDKYLNGLLSLEKVSSFDYDIILEYILGKALLAKFIATHLKTQSSSKT